MPGDRRQILSLLRLPIPPLQRASKQKVSIAPNFPQGGFRLRFSITHWLPIGLTPGEKRSTMR